VKCGDSRMRSELLEEWADGAETSQLYLALHGSVVPARPAMSCKAVTTAYSVVWRKTLCVTHADRDSACGTASSSAAAAAAVAGLRSHSLVPPQSVCLSCPIVVVGSVLLVTHLCSTV
jgi:hypothetical protein